MERARLNFRPQFKGPIEGWAVKYIAKNTWRIPRDVDFDDLLQDAYVMFELMKERYPEVTTPSHFMSLFQRSFMNHVHTLAQARTKRNEVDPGENQEGCPILQNLGSECLTDIHDLELKHLIAEAPPIIARLITELGIVGSQVRVKAQMRKTDGIRETTNQFFCRLLDLDPAEYDISRAVRSWISNATHACH